MLYWLDVVALGVLALGVLRAGGGRRLERVGGLAAVAAGGLVVLVYGVWFAVGANLAPTLLPLAICVGAIGAVFIAEVSGRVLSRGWRRCGRLLAIGWFVGGVTALLALSSLVALPVAVALPAWIAEVARRLHG